jgi:hypothetical protein
MSNQPGGVENVNPPGAAHAAAASRHEAQNMLRAAAFEPQPKIKSHLFPYGWPRCIGVISTSLLGNTTQAQRNSVNASSPVQIHSAANT